MNQENRKKRLEHGHFYQANESCLGVGDTRLVVGDAVGEAVAVGWAGGVESRAWLISLPPQRALVWVLVSEKEKLVLGDRDTFFPQRSSSPFSPGVGSRYFLEAVCRVICRVVDAPSDCTIAARLLDEDARFALPRRRPLSVGVAPAPTSDPFLPSTTAASYRVSRRGAANANAPTTTAGSPSQSPAAQPS